MAAAAHTEAAAAAACAAARTAAHAAVDAAAQRPASLLHAQKFGTMLMLPGENLDLNKNETVLRCLHAAMCRASQPPYDGPRRDGVWMMEPPDWAVDHSVVRLVSLFLCHVSAARYRTSCRWANDARLGTPNEMFGALLICDGAPAVAVARMHDRSKTIASNHRRKRAVLLRLLQTQHAALLAARRAARVADSVEPSRAKYDSALAALDALDALGALDGSTLDCRILGSGVFHQYMESLHCVDAMFWENERHYVRAWRETEGQQQFYATANDPRQHDKEEPDRVDRG